MKTLFNILGLRCASYRCARLRSGHSSNRPGPDQQQTPESRRSGPIPAYRSPLASAADNDDSDSEQYQTG